MNLCVWIPSFRRWSQIKSVSGHLLLSAAEGDLVPTVFPSHRHTAVISSLRWCMNPDQHPRITGLMMDVINSVSLSPPTPCENMFSSCVSVYLVNSFALVWRGFHAAPFAFLKIYFIFISVKLERVNSIPIRLWLRLGTFPVSLSHFSFCTFPLVSLFSLSLGFLGLITFWEWFYSGR